VGARGCFFPITKSSAPSSASAASSKSKCASSRDPDYARQQPSISDAGALGIRIDMREGSSSAVERGRVVATAFEYVLLERSNIHVRAGMFRAGL
jgi:hypothetical protein